MMNLFERLFKKPKICEMPKPSWEMLKSTKQPSNSVLEIKVLADTKELDEQLVKLKHELMIIDTLKNNIFGVRPGERFTLDDSFKLSAFLKTNFDVDTSKRGWLVDETMRLLTSLKTKEGIK